MHQKGIYIEQDLSKQMEEIEHLNSKNAEDEINVKLEVEKCKNILKEKQIIE